jgi:hypothetical protein
MSCYTGFFNVRRGWQSLNTGPRFYLRLIRRTGWLWIYTSRTTDGRPFKPKKLSVPFLYPGVPAVLIPFRRLGRRNLVPILSPAHPLGGGVQAWTWISNVICCGLFCVQWVKVGGDCSFCWYWCNCWWPLFKLSFHNIWLPYYTRVYNNEINIYSIFKLLAVSVVLCHVFLCLICNCLLCVNFNSSSELKCYYIVFFPIFSKFDLAHKNGVLHILGEFIRSTT